MKLLLKQVSISDKLSPYNGLIKDILIEDGKITCISDAIFNNDARIIDYEGAIATPGWIDIFSHFNDPGFEHKESLESGIEAAAAGGYTHVFVLPNTNPVIDNKAGVEYIIQKSKFLPVNILPIGAISKKTDGKELAEMYDMYNSGAVAFLDGILPVQTPGLMLKALQYVKAIQCVLIQLPADNSVSKNGQMNEGMMSTRSGLPGIPAIAEELMISRDIELAKYTGSKLHVTGISTAKSLQLIRSAKAEGVQVTCSVTPYHLSFCDEDLVDFDTNFKVNPPLRSREDMAATRQGIIDETIDCIASHHLPQHSDDKVCEFEYAAFGMTGLQTAFSIVNSLFPDLSAERLSSIFSTNAREIFSLETTGITEGCYADITLYNPQAAFVLTDDINKSKSKNTPYGEKKLTGKVIGIINKDKLYLND